MLFSGIMIGIGMCDGKSAMGIYGLQTEGDFGCMHARTAQHTGGEPSVNSE